MTSYYNEIDQHAAQWLRNLIAAGHIAPGDVDTRSIVDVQPDDLVGYTQVHFFAGIGGWSLAARLAGWPDARPLWTGSCPCQPYSAAGKRKGAEDARNLWPEMRRLVRACRPAVVAGEQVASKDGRIWLAGVRTDLEDVAYDFWAADTCSAGVGSPNIRQRLYWLADTDGGLAGDGGVQRGGQHGHQQEDYQFGRRLGDASGPRGEAWIPTQALSGQRLAEIPDNGGHRRARPWQQCHYLACTDGKARLVEPSIFPLAHGVSNRVGRLRAYGNAINPYVAAEVLGAYLDAPATNSSVTSG